MLLQTHIPSRSTVVALCRIVPSFTMAAHIENLVLNIAFTVAVKLVDVVAKALPLCLLAMRVILLISRVCTVDQSKINFRLMSLDMMQKDV